jgi:HK97 family phage major capsid protein
MVNFPASTASTSESRIAGLLSAGAGPTFAEHLREMQMSAQPTKRRVSAAMFRRDLTAAVASAGGYTVGTTNAPMEQLIRRFSIFGELGLNIITGLDAPITIPSCKTLPSAAWLNAELVNLTESQPVFGQAAYSPKFASAFVQCSRQLILQSQAETIIGTLAAEGITQAIGTAILAGTGTLGQPTGIVNTAGINTQSGTSLALAGLLNMREQALLSGCREDRLVWVGHPTVQELLASRERHAGGGRVLWDDNGILGRPAIATSSAPAGTLICGDFSRCTVVVFDGAGLELEHDPYSDFRSGITAFRLLVPVDVGVSPAAAFSVASSIT